MLVAGFVNNGYSLTVNNMNDIEKARERYEPIVIHSTIPIVDYGYLNGKYIGPQLNPITIAQSVLKDYKKLQKDHYDNDKLKTNIILKADWFLSQAQNMGGYSVLQYNFDFPPRGMIHPWISGMAQAQAIQALIIAHNLTKNTEYLNLADQLLNSFFVSVEQGGVTYKDKDGWWYEEYASEENDKEHRVLNGMGFTLLGIYSYYQYTNSSTAKFLFNKGLESFVNNLPKYDVYPLSLYDLLGKPADEFYHKIHLQILDKLLRITDNKLIKNYYDEWKARLLSNNSQH